MIRPEAFIVHSSPQRLRVRIPSLRGRSELLQPLADRLKEDRDVARVTANPLTGCLVIRGAQGANPLKALERSEAVEMRHGAPPVLTRWGRQARTLATLPPKSPSAALAVLALYQAARGRAMGSAAENFWNAYGSQRLLDSPSLALGFAALGIRQLLAGNMLGPASSLLFYSLILRRIADTGTVRADGPLALTSNRR